MTIHTRCRIFIFIFIHSIVILANQVDKVSGGYNRHHDHDHHEQYKCIARCFFNISFNSLSSFVLPEQCQKRFNSSICQIELNVDYEKGMISGAFDYQDNHANMSHDTDVESGMEMEVREAFHDLRLKKTTKATWAIFCATADECDKRYLDIFLSHTFSNEMWTLFDKISPLLYSNDTNVAQCHTNEETIQTCSDDSVCRYKRNPQFNDGTPEYSCQLYAPEGPLIFFQTHRSKASLPILSDLKKHDILEYTCNKDKCNSPTVVGEVKRLINLEVENTGKSSGSLIFNTQTFFILLFGLFHTGFFNYYGHICD